MPRSLVEPEGKAAAEALKVEAPRSDQAGPAPAIALPRAEPASPLGEALAALDRRDYATARRLFVALGRKDAAEAIDTALAALDRKDYATAQGLFEALRPSTPATSSGGPAAWDAEGDGEPKPLPPPLAVIPPLAPGDRAPPPRAEKKKRGSGLLWLAACLALLGIAGAAVYGSQRNGAFLAVKNKAIASLASAVDGLKSPKAAPAPAGHSDQAAATGDQSVALTQPAERPATGDQSATPAQTTTDRLDRLERETHARFDALDQRSDPNLSAKLADLTARLDALEKKAASPATSPSADPADIAGRLDRLEKKVAVAIPPSTQVSDLTTGSTGSKRRPPPSSLRPPPPRPSPPPPQARQSKARRNFRPRPRRSLRRLSRAPSRPARTPTPGPTPRGVCCRNTASRRFRAALRSSKAAMARSRSAPAISFPARGACCASSATTATGTS